MSSSDEIKKVHPLCYVASLLSLVPLYGVPVGIAYAVYGFVTPKKGGKILTCIGIIGIGVTVLFYLTLRSIVDLAEPFKPYQTETAHNDLTSLVVHLEYYKMQHNKYPETLEVLQASLPKDTATQKSIYDVSQAKIRGKVDDLQNLPLFYYKVENPKHYYLLGVGPDGVPFTSDDVLPEPGPKAKTGLIIKPSSRPSKTIQGSP